VGEVSPEYLRRLARAAEARGYCAPADRLVLKLWEAAENRLLPCEDDVTARAAVTEYDFAPDLYGWD
jgi:hypothetical protein